MDDWDRLDDLDRLELDVLKLTGSIDIADYARERLREVAAAGQIDLTTATVRWLE
jgi:hypothetical protein